MSPRRRAQRRHRRLPALASDDYTEAERVHAHRVLHPDVREPARARAVVLLRLALDGTGMRAFAPIVERLSLGTSLSGNLTMLETCCSPRV